MEVVRAYQQLKNVYHFFQAHWWRVFYRFPDRGMRIYGVTGTNGKTTTCYVLAGILREAYGKEKVGMLSTVGIWLGQEERTNETKMTTINSRELYRCLKEMRARGVEQVVLEVTSHALDQHRLAGLRLDGAAILNIEREHLDYHKTMEKYAAAKRKIADYLKKGAPLVMGKQFTSFKFQFSDVEVVEFSAIQAKSVSTPLPGDFNKENVLAASLLAQAAGVDGESIRRGVAVVRRVPGRMEWINTEIQNPKSKIQNGPPSVLIDYAVTPGALERLYKYVKKETLGGLIAVLGAAGRRDRGKRPDMARVAAAYADEVVLTREDPWTEDEEQIFSDLKKGLAKSNTPWRRVTDRRKAIEYAIGKAGARGVVVVTGKGAETGMGIGKKIIPWSDREVIESILKERAQSG